jgi:hypothetical protein
MRGRNGSAQTCGRTPSPSFASLTRPLPARRGEVNRIIETPSAHLLAARRAPEVCRVIARSQRDEAIQSGAPELDCFA